MALNTAGMAGCLGAVPEPLSTYNRFQSFLYRRRTDKPGLQGFLIVIFGINRGAWNRSEVHARTSPTTGPANVSNGIIIGGAGLVLLMKLWPLPPVKAGQP